MKRGTKRLLAVRQEQARALHEGHPQVLWGNFAGAIGAAAVLHWGSLSQLYWFYWPWLGVFGLFVLWALAVRRRFPVAELQRTARLRVWFHWLILCNALMGLLWGSFSITVILAQDVVYQFAMLTGAAMLTVGALFSVGTFYPVFCAFFLGEMLPTLAALVGTYSPLQIGMAGVACVYAYFMLWFGWRFYISYVDSLLLRFENLELVHKLQLEKDVAEKANFAKSRFLAAASHDLRQPMHALSLYHGAMENLPLASDALTLLHHARRCSEDMDEMFDVLLDISRMDAGAISPRLEVFALQTLLDRTRIEFAPLAAQKGLQLRVTPCSLYVHSDPALLLRIVRNLVANAIRYSQHGKVLVGCRRVRGGVRLGVYDMGCGIAPQQQEAVFEEYVQLSNPERDRTKGLGLGLAIVRRLAALLGVSVTLKSQPGRGSVFSFEMQCVQAPATPEALQMDTSTASLQGCFVVVVDDEAQVRQALAILLKQWGCEVVTASSGEEAVQQLAEHTRVPDILLCDYRLREQATGLDAIQLLRTEFCDDIPALLITGDTAAERLQALRQSGLPVLHKPLRPQALYTAITQNRRV